MNKQSDVFFAELDKFIRETARDRGEPLLWRWRRGCKIIKTRTEGVGALQGKA
jgi:hypothetical protein